MIVGATFGSRESGAPESWKKIYDETKEGDNVNYSTLILQPGKTYIYARQAWTISTGKYYGGYMALVIMPDATSYASTEPTRLELCSGGTAGISLTWAAGGVVTWRCSSAAYRGRVRFYELT